MSVVILAAWLLVLPVVVGGLMAVDGNRFRKNLPFLWTMGQVLLWALFQLICVPFVLMERTLSDVVTVYGTASLGLALLSLLLGFVRYRRKHTVSVSVVEEKRKETRLWHCFLWALFAGLLIFQLVQAVRMTYYDGDDAFYVATSTLAEESDQMYVKMPYTGGYTGLDARHGIAPFPIWIAFLARISGIRTVTMAHVVAPLALIPMTYGIYYLIGKKLFPGKGERLPLFLVLTEILTLFGDYSIYSVENFMIARSRQGKAAIGSILLPVIFFLLIMILERLQERSKVEIYWWLLLEASIMAACLCSTLGTLLSCLLLFVVGGCAAVCYRKWRILLPLALCCLPAVCYAILYLLQD